MNPLCQTTASRTGYIVAIFAVATSVTLCRSAPPQLQQHPEESRFDGTAFRDGLKTRGLTDLLTHYIKEFPPADDIDARLLQRDIKLTESTDLSRSYRQRREAIAEANRILESLINDYPDDKRHIRWQIDLGESLLYSEAEPYTTAILFEGGGPADRKALAEIMERCNAVFAITYAELSADYESLDNLSARVYDKREAKGDIARLERNLAASDYMHAWARYFQTLATVENAPNKPGTDDPDAVQRRTTLRAVLEYLDDRSNLLEASHSETGYQAQATLLSGMTLRQLQVHQEARRQLARTIEIVSSIIDDSQRQTVTWVANLARIELIRSWSDTRDFESAQKAIRLFRNQFKSGSDQDRAMEIIVAILERDVIFAEAAVADRRGDWRRTAQLREQAIQSLRAIASRGGDQQTRVYDALYRRIGPDGFLDSLHPFEKTALIAGLLSEAESQSVIITELRERGLDALDPAVVTVEDRRTALLERVITIAQNMKASSQPIPSDLRPQVLYNLAVAQNARGRRLEAAREFQTVARDHRQFDRAPEAALYAVQIGWQLRTDPALASRPDIKTLLGEALQTLTRDYPHTEGAKYWQFFRAQFLAEREQYTLAAAEYERVASDHERYIEARFLAAECRSIDLNRYAADHLGELDHINRRATEALAAARSAKRTINNARTKKPEDSKRIAELAARIDILTAEIQIVPGVDRHAAALDAIKDFESRHPESPQLIGRVLRVRMISLEALGKHDEAARLIPQYVKTDPEGAPPTLQGLYDLLTEEINRDRIAGRTEQANERAISAAVLAGGIYDLAAKQPEIFGPDARYALRLQYAEAILETGALDRAEALFNQCIAENASKYPDATPHDSRAIQGAARTFYLKKQYEKALPLYNSLFRGVPRGERIWWEALLGELQCRTQMNYKPARIVKSIRQHKFLDAEMGGRDLHRQFDALLEENKARVAEETSK